MTHDTLNGFTYVLEHYHANDAGMNEVIHSIVNGFLSFRNDVFFILVYSSKKYQDRVNNDINLIEVYNHPDLLSFDPDKHDLSSLSNAIRSSRYWDYKGIIFDMPELGYSSRIFSSVNDFLSEAKLRRGKKIDYFKKLLKINRPIVHHILNPTLMKNPVETYANYLMAIDLLSEPYIQLRHVHDLTEDTLQRKDLRAIQRKIAGDQTTKFFGLNGSGISWQTSPNIFYAAINLKDYQAIKAAFNFKSTVLHYIPNPVNLNEITAKPIWEKNGLTLDNALFKYATKQGDSTFRFNCDAHLLLATEVARERKNTGEQLLLLRLLNKLSGKLQKYQLLISMLPSSKNDLLRIEVFKKYIKIHEQPVIMGFAKDILCRGINIPDDKFHIRDLWNHPRTVAVLSTSTNEGFGYNFVNPAISTLHNRHHGSIGTIGRRLTSVFNNLSLYGTTFPGDAYYDSIFIDYFMIENKYRYFISDNLILNITKARESNPEFNYYLKQYDQNINEIKLNSDFSKYNALEQMILIDLIDYKQLAKKLNRFIRYLNNPVRMNLVATYNAIKLKNCLSVESFIFRLEKILINCFVQKSNRIKNNEKPSLIKDNHFLTQFYQNNSIDAEQFYLNLTYVKGANFLQDKRSAFTY